MEGKEKNSMPQGDPPLGQGIKLLEFYENYKKPIWGFFGWFLIASILSPVSLGLIITPFTIFVLIMFGFSKKDKSIAGGILVAVSINFVVSLMRNMQFNATCFIPFYVDVF